MLKQALDNSRYKRQIQEENENSAVLSDRVNKLEEKLNLIIEKLESVENGTNKMTTHIDFINDIYNFYCHFPVFRKNFFYFIN